MARVSADMTHKLDGIKSLLSNEERLIFAIICSGVIDNDPHFFTDRLVKKFKYLLPTLSPTRLAKCLDMLCEDLYKVNFHKWVLGEKTNE